MTILLSPCKITASFMCRRHIAHSTPCPNIVSLASRGCQEFPSDVMSIGKTPNDHWWQSAHAFTLVNMILWAINGRANWIKVEHKVDELCVLPLRDARPCLSCSRCFVVIRTDPVSSEKIGKTINKGFGRWHFIAAFNLVHSSFFVE